MVNADLFVTKNNNNNNHVLSMLLKLIHVHVDKISCHYFHHQMMDIIYY